MLCSWVLRVWVANHCYLVGKDIFRIKMFVRVLEELSTYCLYIKDWVGSVCINHLTTFYRHVGLHIVLDPTRNSVLGDVSTACE